MFINWSKNSNRRPTIRKARITLNIWSEFSISFYDDGKVKHRMDLMFLVSNKKTLGIMVALEISKSSMWMKAVRLLHLLICPRNKLLPRKWHWTMIEAWYIKTNCTNTRSKLDTILKATWKQSYCNRTSHTSIATWRTFVKIHQNVKFTLVMTPNSYGFSSLDK